jgi:uncharacterized membrane protein (UPF0127 family)
VPDDHRVEILNLTRGTSIATSARTARSIWARGRGLMFARELPQGTGLLIDPCGSIHMFFMRFALDVLYVDRDDRVVRVQRGIRPWRVGPLYTKGARYVVELPVGSIDSSGTQVGDQVRIDGR